MNHANSDAAWAILVDRKAERKENRPAFLAALIYERVREANPSDQIEAHHAEAFAVEFVRLARLIKAEAEAACSFERTPPQIAAGEAAEARFAALAEALGFEARTGGDPRGACAYLIDPAQRKGDGWGEGWAVYS